MDDDTRPREETRIYRQRRQTLAHFRLGMRNVFFPDSGNYFVQVLSTNGEDGHGVARYCFHRLPYCGSGTEMGKE